MNRQKLLISGIALGAAIAVAGVLPSWTSGGTKTQTLRPVKAAAGASRVQAFGITIRSSAPGLHAVAPGNLAVAPGVPVKITITNFTQEFHSFSIPGLHVSAVVHPAHGQVPGKTTVTFTAADYGSYDWYCAFCTYDRFKHRQPMHGTVYVIIDPALLS